jgi:hypothetical protein
MRRARLLSVVAGAVLLSGCAGSALTVRLVHPGLAVAPTATSTAPKHLPRGGTAIIGHYRVVAYYGAPGTAALGVLGSGSPELAARAIEKRARGFARYGRPVQPAMELIATVAQGSAGKDGDYSKAVPAAQIQRYLDVVHKHKMLLILDLQPGRATFLRQMQALRPFLLDPSVSIALDPEWKVGPHERPGGGRIGSSSAAEINAGSHYLSLLVKDHKLPHKLMIVHEFTQKMLPDRSKITRAKGVELTFHADGFGSPAVKTRVYSKLHFPGPPFGVGFKLFLHQDSRVMTPREVMALRPRPDIVTYQ